MFDNTTYCVEVDLKHHHVVCVKLKNINYNWFIKLPGLSSVREFSVVDKLDSEFVEYSVDLSWNKSSFSSVLLVVMKNIEYSSSHLASRRDVIL